MKENVATPSSADHITVSSCSNNTTPGLLRCSYNKNKNDSNRQETISINTSDSERCPVTWYGSINKQNARLRLDYVNDKATPSPKSKVLSWINDSCKLQNNTKVLSSAKPFRSYLESQLFGSVPSPDVKVSSWINNNCKSLNKSDRDSHNEPPFTEAYSRRDETRVFSKIGDGAPFTDTHLTTLTAADVLTGKCNIEQHNKSSVFVRQDYKKHENVSILKLSEDSRTNESGCSRSSDRNFKADNITNSTKKACSESSLFTKYFETDNHFASKNTESCANVNSCKGNEKKNCLKICKQKCESDDIPLSPESQKKKELYTYLQLMNMNPTSSHEEVFIQNRRSTRVKNYIALSEKKKLETELKNESNENLCRKSFSQLGLNVALSENEVATNKTNIFPALPRRISESCEGFDNDMQTFLNSEKVDLKKILNGCVNNLRIKSDKEKQLMGRKRSKKKIQIRTRPKRLNNKSSITCYLNKKNRQLRSTGMFKNVELKKMILQNFNPDKIAWKKLMRKRQLRRQPLKVHLSKISSDAKTQLKHKNDVSNPNSRLLTGNSVPKVLLTRFNEYSLNKSPLDSLKVIVDKNSSSYSTFCCGFKSDPEIERKEKMLNDICLRLFNRIVIGPAASHENPLFDTVSAKEESECVSPETVIVDPDSNTPDIDHNYSKHFEDDEGDVSSETIERESPEIFNIDEISSTNCDILPLNVNVEMKSLHRNLTQMKRKHYLNNFDLSDEYNQQTWDSDTLHTAQKVQKIDKRNNNCIFISESKGAIINAFYIDYNLIIVQDLVVTFWSQSALGNVLGAQNLWIPKGSVQRLVLDKGCVHRKSKETVISLENSVAYVELWTKEHKSDKRERPVSDVFATIYFCRHRHYSLDKKVLQLENIKGFAEDVQYVVLTSSRNIIVSWSGFCDENKITIVHCYNLANDYQTVLSIKEMKSVEHYVSSLNNIEDCDSLVLGYGENKVTLWNIDYGYVVATVELLQTSPHPSILWAKCDRGFLFALQCFNDGKIRLVAINGINHSWKCLQVYKPPQPYERLRGICMDNEILVAFYENGFLSWNVQTGQLIFEEMCNEAAFIPSGKHVIINVKEQIIVKHMLSYLVMCDV